ncbi:MAG: alpha-methylacyl-CoA racemase [Actinomycetota bacterium]|nr:alpha-methylacyl-CoA racemase [Actinomycetota bacterium]
MSRTGEESQPSVAAGSLGSGPLTGVTLLELGGIGPLPLLAMLFADLGARVIRIDPVNPALYRISTRLWIFRGHESVTLDLGQDEGREVLMRMVEHADILVEGYRAGVAERLGVGPEDCLARNPRLVYGRMTGWGSSGPLADKGGHDINYMAITGALQAIGPKDAPPPPPLNLVADFGGGGMMLAMGVLAALHEREQSGRGQVVESAMSDGVLGLMSLWFAIRDTGSWNPERGVNQIQGGAPFYRCYETSDGEYLAVGAVENKFYAALIDGLGLDPALVTTQNDMSKWPELISLFGEVFRTRTRAEWEDIFAERDACVTPVLTMAEATQYPHNVERDAFVEANGFLQVAPPVRFGRTPGSVGGPSPEAGADTERILTEYGFDDEELGKLRAAGVIE